jgi:hypothetical protein
MMPIPSFTVMIRLMGTWVGLSNAIGGGKKLERVLGNLWESANFKIIFCIAPLHKQGWRPT